VAYYKNTSIIERNNGMIVIRKPGEPFEILLKRFKKKVMNCQILQELKMRQEFEKPSQKRMRKKRAAIKRTKDLNKQQRK
jgi:small subunit ribosomal protein S21